MPFTPTHVLAVAPIAAVSRGALPFSALAIGSMIPDFPLFSPLSPAYDTTHSARGLISACLPLGLAGFLVFQSLLKRPLLALMPRAVRRRSASFSGSCVEPTLKSFVLISLAVVAGAATHLLWDSFTHRGRWGTRLFPRLDETVLTVWGNAVPGYKLLQYGSTLIGLPCLVLLLAVWLYRRGPETSGGRQGLRASAKVLAYLVGMMIPAFVGFFVWCSDDSSRYDRLGRSITLSGRILVLAILAYCLAFHAIEGLKRGSSDGGIERH